MNCTESLMKMKTTIRSAVSEISISEGLVASEAMIMLLLSHKDNVAAKEIVKVSGQNQGNVSAICKRIERAGLMTRVRGSEDERIVMLNLTEEGQNVADRLEAKLDKLNQLIQDECAEDGIDFRQTMDKMCVAMVRAASVVKKDLIKEMANRGAPKRVINE